MREGSLSLIIDGSFLGPQIGGIGRYTIELARALRRRPDVASLSFWHRGELVDDEQDLWALSPRRRSFRFHRYLRRRSARRALPAHVFHGTNYFLPAEVRAGVVTLHDLSVFRFPETHPPERVADFERRIGPSLQRAAQIITDTETVRQEAIEYFGLAQDRVTAVHLGIGSQFQPREESELVEALAALRLAPGAYALCVAQTEPRKKLRELIAAWRSLPLSLRSRFPLVLAGGGGWRNDAIHHEIAAGEREGFIRHLGFVEEALLPALYAGARIFAYPSTYEGFGLPPLEAMASGVPVVVANRSCLPEVCGPAARYIDPDDIDSLRDGLIQALEDEPWRVEARAAGLAHAATKTWDKCAAETVEVYRRVARS